MSGKPLFSESKEYCCAAQAFAAMGKALHWFSPAGFANVRPPVASWQISNVTSCPAWQLASDEPVTLPVSVSLCTLPSEQSNVGVAENVTVFNVPGRQSVRDVPALSAQMIPEKKFTPVRCVCPIPELKIC